MPSPAVLAQLKIQLSFSSGFIWDSCKFLCSKLQRLSSTRAGLFLCYTCEILVLTDQVLIDIKEHPRETSWLLPTRKLHDKLLCRAVRKYPSDQDLNQGGFCLSGKVVRVSWLFTSLFRWIQIWYNKSGSLQQSQGVVNLWELIAAFPMSLHRLALLESNLKAIKSYTSNLVRMHFISVLLLFSSPGSAWQQRIELMNGKK